MATNHVAPAPCEKKQLLSIEDVIASFRRWLPLQGEEEAPLAEALFRILAEDIMASHPIAPYDSAAMDGFAFLFDDMPADRCMEVVARVSAGHPMTKAMPRGKAARIFTGASMPLGTDTVAMQEDCEVVEDFVKLPAGLRQGTNRRRAGEDVPKGGLVLATGSRLRPQDIGIAAAAGRAALTVKQRLRVAILATGDELRAPGELLPEGCIFDTNRHAVGAALRGLGAQVHDFGLVPDRQQAIRDMLEHAASACDLIISSGGVSAGEEDHVRAAVMEIGSLDFWKVAMKPGKPVAMGEIAGTPFVGLPGNPVAAMITFWLLVRPLVLQLMGATDISATRIPIVADFRQRHQSGRREYLRARLHRSDNGKLRAEPYHSTGSAMMSSLIWSDGLLELHENRGDIEIGDILDFISYESLSY